MLHLFWFNGCLSLRSALVDRKFVGDQRIIYFLLTKPLLVLGNPLHL